MGYFTSFSARLLLSASITALALPAAAELSDIPKGNTHLPIMVEAATLNYDKKTATVTASGNVEVVQGERILLADSIIYDQNTNIVKARGNVSVLETSGSVYFADEVTLQDDMKRGVVEQFRIRLADNSVFAAKEARRISEDVTELVNAVYSPCKLCKENPEKAPLWQVKADKVVYDDLEKQVTYDNASLEFYGVPILYTPYFSHATPDVKRKSGILTPEYSHSSNLGVKVKVPYYYSIAPDKDVTLTPVYTSEEGPVMMGEYRQRFDNGQIMFDTSATYPRRRDEFGNEIDGNEFRGHIFTQGDFAANDTFDWGFDVRRTTDDTYLRRYNISDEDNLTSRVYLDGAKDNMWGSVQGLSFQGLRVGDDPDRTPYILPLFDASYESDPMLLGSRFSVDANALYLTRQLGVESRRLSLNGGWTLPYVTDNGHWFEVSAGLRGDAYSVENVPDPNDPTDDFNGATARVIPQASLLWRYPLIKQLDDSSLILEPTVNLVVSPNGANSDKIPNEDNLSLEYSDISLFDDNRFPGMDVVETGPRSNYGIRARWQFADNRAVNAMFGQSYSFSDGNPYIATQGGNNASDYVGKVAIEYHPLDVAYRFLIDRDNGGLKRNDVNARLSLHPVNLSADFTSLDEDILLPDRREILASTSVALNENWTLSGFGRRDLTDAGSWVSAGTSIAFQNECLTVWGNMNRNFTRDRDYEPDTSVSLRFSLKNIN